MVQIIGVKINRDRGREKRVRWGRKEKEKEGKGKRDEKGRNVKEE